MYGRASTRGLSQANPYWSNQTHSAEIGVGRVGNIESCHEVGKRGAVWNTESLCESEASAFEIIMRSQAIPSDYATGLLARALGHCGARGCRARDADARPQGLRSRGWSAGSS